MKTRLKKKSHWKNIMLTGLLASVSVAMLTAPAGALVPERRNGVDAEKLGWLLLPSYLRVEGIGETFAAFGIVSNLYEGTDVLAGKSLPGGDIDFAFLHVDSFPLFTRHLTLSGTRFKGKAPAKVYNRGINSSATDYIQPLMVYEGVDFKVALKFWEDRINLSYFDMRATATTLKIFDNQGNLLSNKENSEGFNGKTYTVFLDFTDDQIDPRMGLQVGRKVKPKKSNFDIVSDIEITDSAVSGYVPLFGKDTLVLNYFRSTSAITRQGVTDPATARAILDQGCVVGSPNYQDCINAENKRVADFLAYNRYGLATTLGGDNRMRAYPLNRFFAGNASYRAVEYRLNFSEKPREFNFYVVGGVKTMLQMAFFFEQGTVNDDASKLNTQMRDSYGVGFRAQISGIIYRVDLARGDEGGALTIFFEYPMSFSPLLE